MAFFRKTVSRNKRRYQKDGYDLDLSYITPRLVAMGFPSENVEGVYRNPLKEVLRFLDDKHKDHYRVYNLCSERSYDISKFYNRVECFPFDDHNAPPLEMIFKFCENVKAWLSADSRNVSVIHCKAGKGRTGLMICAYLVWSREWKTATDALSFYAAMRTYNQKGVTIPSQIRYVYYTDAVMTKLNGVVPEPRPVILKSISLYNPPKHATDFRFSIWNWKTLIFTYSPELQEKIDLPTEKPRLSKRSSALEGEDDKSAVVFECGKTPICGDIKIEFFDKKEAKLFHFWFNTAFVDEITVFTKSEIDKAVKDKHHKTWKQSFKVVLETQILAQSEHKPLLLSVKRPSIDAPKPADGVLNAGPAVITDRSGCEVVESLLTQLVELIMVNKADRNVIRTNDSFTTFQMASTELQKINVGQLTQDEKLSFWINCYNLLSLHGWIANYDGSHPPASAEERLKWSKSTKYEVDYVLYSLYDIEFSILRANLCRSPLLDLVKDIKPMEVEKTEHLAQSDPRVVFALNGISSSTPPFRIYRSKTLYDDLEKQARHYLSESVSISGNKITLPKILDWYAEDFGKTKEKLVKTLNVYLSPNVQKETNNALSNNAEVVFSDYDWHTLESVQLLSRSLALFQLR